MELKESLLLHDLDKTLAIAGIISSIILITYLGMEFGRVVYLLTGVLSLISCLLWLAMQKNHTFEFHSLESRTQTIFFATCFFGLYIVSTLSVYLRAELYERPLLYFILTAVMAGVIALEIFTSSRRHASSILIQILLLGLSIAWSQLLIFPSLLGVDPWYHSALTNQIINEGLVPEGYAYSKLPLFHLMIAMTSLAADLPYKYAAIASVSFVQIICNAVFVFLIANRLFKNHQMGLLAALLAVIANHHIFMSYWSIPNAFAAIFIPITLYLLFFLFKGGICLTSAIFYTMTLSPIILTHTITAMCMAILLFVTWSTLAFYRRFKTEIESYVPLSIPVCFTIAMLAWWTFASDSIGTLIDLFKSGFSINFFETTPEDLRGYAAIVPLEEQLFNNLGVFLFFVFSFIGIFYMISRRGNSASFAIAWVGMTPLTIGFFSLILGYAVIEHRWWYFAQILLSIPLSAAIYTVGTWKSKKSLYFYGFVFGFVLFLSIFMIMSPPANADNLFFSPNSHIRCSLTEGELEIMTTLVGKWDGTIKTDEYLAGSQKFQYSQVSPFCQQVYSNDYVSLSDSIVVIREAIVGRPFKLFSSIYRLDYDLNIRLDRQGFSRIYDSNSGSGYQTRHNHFNAYQSSL